MSLSTGAPSDRAWQTSLRERLVAGPTVVFDLEWTSWEGAAERNWAGPGEFREIVQIGAVCLAAGSLEETGAFEILIRPVLNPRLSAYFDRLTGIKQADVDGHGRPFADAMAAFTAFCSDPAGVFFNGADNLVLHANCGLHRMACTIPDHAFVNLRPLIAAELGIREPFVSSDLPRFLGHSSVGPAHQGLADARAVALALRALAAV